jgi:polysaccharide biosynthesis/export protein
MKNYTFIFIAIVFLAVSCTSQKKLAYLNNLREAGGQELFTMVIPGYKIQPRDVLYITIKAMTPEGRIIDFMITENRNSAIQMGSDATSYLYGFDVNQDGNIILPEIGAIKVEGFTLEEAREILQSKADSVFRNSTVECKLLSFKFTVIGEVKAPGAYVNYNNYLTVLEAIGRAGGVGDYGNRDRVLVIRSTGNGSKTFKINLQDKNILSSEAYYLLPNDVVIVEPLGLKVFNLNLPTIAFIITTITSTITTTLLLVDYFGN